MTQASTQFAARWAPLRGVTWPDSNGSPTRLPRCSPRATRRSPTSGSGSTTSSGPLGSRSRRRAHDARRRGRLQRSRLLSTRCWPRSSPRSGALSKSAPARGRICSRLSPNASKSDPPWRSRSSCWPVIKGTYICRNPRPPATNAPNFPTRPCRSGWTMRHMTASARSALRRANPAIQPSPARPTDEPSPA